MRRYVMAACLLSVMSVGCTPAGVEKKTESTEKDGKVETPKTSENVQMSIDGDYKVGDELKMDNGIVIKWFKHGSGEKLVHADFVLIDYKVILKDQTIVDGNHLLNKPSIPFMVGFKMQTEGWDIALKELRVGDFAEIFIPSKLARGEKGIEGLIPPNADNILRIRIIEKKIPTREVEGNKVWVFENNPNNKKKFGDDTEIEFHCMVSTPSNPMYVNTYRSNTPFKLRMEDSGTVPGLKKALINAKKSDRMFVYIPSSQAYGTKGYLDIVKPNEDLLYNVLVMDIHDK